MRRLALSLMLTALFAGQASARCDGRYDHVSAMIDAAMDKYGTLYSGGFHHAALDDVGASIDLYRMWRGLPDLALRDMHGQVDLYGYEYVDEDFAEKLAESLPVLEAATPFEGDPVRMREAAIGLDLATSVGGGPGWWIDQNKSGYRSDALNIVAAASERQPGLDWLLTVLTASNAPWSPVRLTAYGIDADEGWDELAGRSLAKWENGDGWEWAAAALALRRPGGVYDHRLGEIADRLAQKAVDCTADEQEFAVFATSLPTYAQFIDAQAALALAAISPNSVRRQVAVDTARWSLFHAHSMPAESVLRQTLGLLDETDDRRWASTGLVYATGQLSAGDLRDGKFIRLLNLVPADRLAELSRHADGDIGLLIGKAAAVRLLALGRTDDAWTALKALSPRLPAGEFKAVQSALQARAPRDVRAATALLRIGASAWLSGGFYDQPYAYDAALHIYDERTNRLGLRPEFRDGAAIQRDFETWSALPQYWGAFRGMRGYTWEAIGRVDARRGWNAREDVAAPDLFDPSGPYGIARVVDLNEINQLTADAAPVRRFSQILLDWSQRQTRTFAARLWAPSDLVAEALHHVVRINRYEDSGLPNGVRPAHAAFKRLHKYFESSVWAVRTPYWHEPRRGY